MTIVTILNSDCVSPVILYEGATGSDRLQQEGGVRGLKNTDSSGRNPVQLSEQKSLMRSMDMKSLERINYDTL